MKEAPLQTMLTAQAERKPYPEIQIERDRWILERRPSRAAVDPWRPNAFLIEKEPGASGEIVEVATIFLTGRECPWRCLMCDLWKHTTEERTPVGAIPAQIDFALTELGGSRQVEIPNSSGGKPAVGRVLSESFGPTASSSLSFPLTPALSPGEREPARQRVELSTGSNSSSAAGGVPPLLGERAGVRGNGAHKSKEVAEGSAVGDCSPRHLKLYNAGSFFDRAAVPVEDYEPIARRAAGFDRVIVESHPALIGDLTLRFRDLLNATTTQGPSEVRQVLDCGGAPPLFKHAQTHERATKRQSIGAVQDPGASEVASRLEVAMGLETAHPEALEKLNKRVTLDQFASAAAFLKREGIALRVFVLVKPPFMNEPEALEWAVKSAQFAFDCGAEVVSLIPTRFGNGALEDLAAQGQFGPPKLDTLEAALEQSIALGRGRVFADLWDLQRFSDCTACFAARLERLGRMNLEQTLLPLVSCAHCP